MNEKIHADPRDIISIILKDHVPLKKLITNLKDAHYERSEKEAWLEDFITILTGHAKSEEQSLYIAMKEYDMLKLESYQGDTEHAIAEQLVQEINSTPNDDGWLAKVKVLAEMVENHIEEEETEILDMVRQEIELSARIGIGDEYTKLSQDYNHLHTNRPQLTDPSVGMYNESF